MKNIVDDTMSSKDFEALLIENRSLILEKISNLADRIIHIDCKIDKATDNINNSFIKIALLENDVCELKKSNSENWKVTRSLQSKILIWTGSYSIIAAIVIFLLNRFFK